MFPRPRPLRVELPARDRVPVVHRLDALGHVQGPNLEAMAFTPGQVGDVQTVLGPGPATKEAVGRIGARFLGEAAHGMGTGGAGVHGDRNEVGVVAGGAGGVDEGLGAGGHPLSRWRLKGSGLDHGGDPVVVGVENGRGHVGGPFRPIEDRRRCA